MEFIKRHIVSCMACVILLVFSNIAISMSAKTYMPSTYDSVHISLLTCSSHPEVYSLYGHTAIRYQNLATGQDYAINYGVFDFSDKWFIPKFTFGIADYSIGIVPFYYFESEYRRYGSSITQQEINLTPEEKKKLSDALADNYRPENRIYRYNCFYKNCSTMARDIIVNSIDGRVVYPESQEKLSFRDLTHQCNDDYPWARLGNDLVLGMGADFNTTVEERQFLPEYLMNDFEKAVIEKNGEKRPLVKSTVVLLQPGTQIPMEEFPISPVMCAVILLLACTLLLLYENYRRVITLWFDAVMMTVMGIAGIIIVVMFLSQHPTTSTNLMIFILNPLPLFFIRSIYKAGKKGVECRWWKIWMAMGVLSLISGMLVQDFDNSMLLVSVVIIIRAAIHLRYEKGMKLKK